MSEDAAAGHSGNAYPDRAAGACLCGAVRYAVAGPPLWVSHCHCAPCRRNTGSAVATFVGYGMGQVSWSGESRAFYESSPGVQRGFCKRCGTPMSYEGDRAPGETHVYLSTLETPEAFPAENHVFYAERIPWFDTADDRPRHPGTDPEG